jgi:hypothetical protein
VLDAFLWRRRSNPRLATALAAVPDTHATR